ncbi:hypothetical protein GGR57DRAFT_517681 [Xylariaceae sp. FL1272]|nr:hypothetical protein GGR57DRAFT_517681 [Xylariaceae sp. FL1272]
MDKLHTPFGEPFGDQTTLPRPIAAQMQRVRQASDQRDIAEIMLQVLAQMHDRVGRMEAIQRQTSEFVKDFLEASRQDLHKAAAIVEKFDCIAQEVMKKNAITEQMNKDALKAYYRKHDNEGRDDMLCVVSAIAVLIVVLWGTLWYQDLL